MPSLDELLAAGELPRATQLAHQRLERDPRDTLALVALAKVALLEGDAARAEPLLQRAEAVDAGPDVLHVRAFLALQREDWAGARALYLRLAADNALRPEGWYSLGLAMLNTGDLEEAREALELAVRFDPRAPSFRFELGRAWALLGRERLAARQLVACLRLDPRDVRAWRLLAELLAERGKARSARRLLELGLRAVPEAQVLREPLPAPQEPHAELIKQATLMMNRGRNREALALVREAQGGGARSLSLKLLEARACEALLPVDVEGAVRAYEEAMALAPRAWEPCNDLGLFLLKRGQRHRARAFEAMKEAQRRAPTRPEPTFNLALAYSKNGQRSECAELARQLVASLPETNPYHAYARALLRDLDKG